MKSIFLHYLNGPDVSALAMSDDEIIAAVEVGLLAQGRGETVIEPEDRLFALVTAEGESALHDTILGSEGA